MPRRAVLSSGTNPTNRAQKGPALQGRSMCVVGLQIQPREEPGTKLILACYLLCFLYIVLMTDYRFILDPPVIIVIVFWIDVVVAQVVYSNCHAVTHINKLQ